MSDMSTATTCTPTPTPTAQAAALQHALLVEGQAATAAPMKALLGQAQQHFHGAAAAEFIEAAIPLCKQLHAHGRAFDALPLARTCTELAERADHVRYPRLRWQSATAVGNLCLQTGDYLAAIAEHSRALRLAEAAEDSADQARTWNNLGGVFKDACAHFLAIECFSRAYERYALGRVSSRYSALTNMAYCQLYLGNLRMGRAAATLALRYETAAYRSENPYAAVVLRSNMVRLLAAANKKEAARPLAKRAYQLAAKAPSLLMDNVVTVTRAALDIAYGRIDLGISRLERELPRVRHLPEPCTDTLLALIHAEQAAGQPQRAQVYWLELSDLRYKEAAEQAQQHLAIRFFSGEPPFPVFQAPGCYQPNPPAASLPPATVAPAEWEALERMAQSAGLTAYADTSHGIRVGELTRMLAIEAGYSGDEASELGLAARMHDIGLIHIPPKLLHMWRVAGMPVPALGADVVDWTVTPLPDRPFDLTEALANFIHQHSKRGAELLLSQSRHPRALLAAQIARYHHTPWQNSGGAKAIPEAARLTAITDAIDEIFMRHADAKTLPPAAIAAATAYLQAEAGRRLDPELTALCLRSLESGLIGRNLARPLWWYNMGGRSLEQLLGLKL